MQINSGQGPAIKDELLAIIDKKDISDQIKSKEKAAVTTLFNILQNKPGQFRGLQSDELTKIVEAKHILDTIIGSLFLDKDNVCARLIHKISAKKIVDLVVKEGAYGIERELGNKAKEEKFNTLRTKGYSRDSAFKEAGLRRNAFHTKQLCGEKNDTQGINYKRGDELKKALIELQRLMVQESMPCRQACSEARITHHQYKNGLKKK